MNYEPWIKVPPAEQLDTIIVMPVYAEENITIALESLACCDRDGHVIEVLVVVNDREDEVPEVRDLNRSTEEEVVQCQMDLSASNFQIHLISARSLPSRKAGVGLARKIGMDEALHRFHLVKGKGLIINFDADCTCDGNFMQAIHRYFDRHPEHWAAGIYFEHDLEGLENDLMQAIMRYEMHLRYFIYIQRQAGLPFAYHTVGSSMAVTSEGYMRMGGMNTRQAGEDFHFLQKFIAADHFGEIPETTVHPSARPSFRVPFGTGKAVDNILSGQPQLTCAPQSFYDLSPLIRAVHDGFADTLDTSKLSEPLSIYLDKIAFHERIRKLAGQTGSMKSFQKRFFQWFNALQVIKYVHHCRDWYPDRPVQLVVREQYRLIHGNDPMDEHAMLDWLRREDRMSMGSSAE